MSTPANRQWEYAQARRREARDSAIARIHVLDHLMNDPNNDPAETLRLQREHQALQSEVTIRGRQIEQGNCNYCLGTIVMAVISLVVVLIVFFSF